MNKQKFEGKINGELFTDVKEFNKKVAEMIESGENYNISYGWSTENTPNEEKQGCKCGCNGNCGKIKLTPEEISYLFPRYVYGTLGGDMEKNEEELIKITNDLDTRFDEFIKWYDNNTCECELNRVLERVVKVTSELEESTKKISNKYKQLEDKAKKLREELEHIEIEKGILLQEGRIVEDIVDYYEHVQEELDSEDEESVEINEKDPQKEYSLSELFSNKDNSLDNILERIEPSLDENSKEQIKKYATELVEQFNNLLRCF
jgi:predicted ribosome quality control (RQC) complex YloA/Tae2 family protein